MAGYIPEDIVEKIKADTDILDLVSEYVTLKKTGKDYTGLCPFHREKTPSFTVIPAKNFYYCFGCGASGSAVNFIMQHENLDYPEALKFLAKRAGVTIPEKSSGDSFAGKLYQAVELAQAFFAGNLKNSKAYDYLKQRGVGDEVIKELKIGFAPAGWDNLLQEILRRKLSPEIFEKAGLLVKSDKQAGYYDKFRNRLMFPIFNLSGRVIGFGGRTLNEEEGPKYLNSPETAIYHKGSILYGLNISKNNIRQAGKAIVCEGYFDYVSLHQAGIQNIVAVSGTGFTPNQANLLARFGNEVVLLYDADSAGMKATFRAVEILYNAGLEPLIVRLPEGSDPDSYLKEKGAVKLKELIEQSTGYLDFLRDSLPDKFSRLSITRQENVINSLIETASGIQDNLRYELFIRKAIEVFDLPPGAATKFKKRESVSQAGKTAGISGRCKFEMTFLGLLISHPEFIDECIHTIKPENFSDNHNAEIYTRLRELGDKEFSVGDLLERFSDEPAKRRLTEIIIGETTGAPPEILFSDSLSKFRKYQLSDRLAAIRAEIARAEKEGELQKSEKLNREYRDLQNAVNRKVV
jgi:DNA primase